jgi:hypothetical protein
MLDTPDIWSSTSYKLSPTWSSRPVRIQPTTLNGSADISFIRRWKEDNESFLLVMVRASEDLWILLCEHGKVLRHLF